MATLREYFDSDFSYAIRVHVKLPASRPDVDVALLYDFSAYTAFFSCYMPGDQHTLQEFLRLVEALQPGKAQVLLDGKVGLPSARMFPGALEIRNTHPFEIHAKFHGDPEWMATSEIPSKDFAIHTVICRNGAYLHS